MASKPNTRLNHHLITCYKFATVGPLHLSHHSFGTLQQDAGEWSTIVRYLLFLSVRRAISGTDSAGDITVITPVESGIYL